MIRVRREAGMMHLEGEHTFSASQRHVWERLNDAGVLARITPGLDELQAQDEDTYRAVFAIKMGPINSTFGGTLQVVDRVAPQRFRLLIDIAGTVGTVDAAATVTAAPVADTDPERTRVTFAAEAKLTGVLVRMGQRVLSGVGRLLTKQFFQALERELQVATPLQEEDP
jgi:carbon monoxide dehydrogenase subunit G